MIEKVHILAYSPSWTTAKILVCVCKRPIFKDWTGHNECS